MEHRMKKRYAPLACALATSIALACAPTALADDDVRVTDVSPTTTGETLMANQTAASVASCVAPTLAKSLAAYGDTRDYFLAPSANFDAGATGWQLRNGAGVVSGNGGKVLRLPAGASAITPLFCVDVDYPTFRLFAAELEGEDEATLAVDVIYPSVATRNVRRSARLKAGSRMSLSRDIDLHPEFAGATPGWRTVAIRLTALGDDDGEFRVDNLFVDPRMRM
jgi:hypothetical protein